LSHLFDAGAQLLDVRPEIEDVRRKLARRVRRRTQASVLDLEGGIFDRETSRFLLKFIERHRGAAPSASAVTRRCRSRAIHPVFRLSHLCSSVSQFLEQEATFPTERDRALVEPGGERGHLFFKDRFDPGLVVAVTLAWRHERQHTPSCLPSSTGAEIFCEGTPRSEVA